MAQKYVVQVTDDLDGSELDAHDVQEVRFGIDGRSYVIDLSTSNATKLRNTLARYTDAARRDQVAGRNPASTRGSRGGRKDLNEVREWAKSNGHDVAVHGRVGKAVLEAYDNR